MRPVRAFGMKSQPFLHLKSRSRAPYLEYSSRELKTQGYLLIDRVAMIFRLHKKGNLTVFQDGFD